MNTNTTPYAFNLMHGESIQSLQGLKVYVYFNLHKHLFSIKALEGPNKGRVVAHADLVKLSECQFKVSEAGRQRVIREQKKYVHAGVVGVLVGLDDAIVLTPEVIAAKGFQRAYYNPYKVDSFMHGTARLKEAGRVALYKREIFFADGIAA